MVADVFEILSLTTDQARVVGATALVVIFVLDVLASADDVAGNTPREWIIRLTQWRSLWFWNAANQQRAKEAGEWNVWLVPLNYLPMTGAVVPFLCAALIGHFFHPWSTPPIDLGWWGLGSIGLLCGAVSVVTFFMGGEEEKRGERLVAWIAALGLVAGVFLWPVAINSTT